MRLGVAIIGGILLVVAVIVLIDGNNKLSLYSACTSFQVFCPSGVSPNSTELAYLADGAKLEIIYGYIFGGIGLVVLLFGLIGRSNESIRDEEEEHGRRGI